MAWLDHLDTPGRVGWEPRAPIDTWWLGDPAVDESASDAQRYLVDLDKSALVVRKGKTPQNIRVALPADAAELMAIRHHIAGDFAAACAVAFALCVRFPSLDVATPENTGGLWMLPRSFMVPLSNDRDGADMISGLGSWIISHSLLSEQEKKASSPESGQTSSSSAPSTAPAATTDEDSSKGAQT